MNIVGTSQVPIDGQGPRGATQDTDGPLAPPQGSAMRSGAASLMLGGNVPGYKLFRSCSVEGPGCSKGVLGFS